MPRRGVARSIDNQVIYLEAELQALADFHEGIAGMAGGHDRTGQRVLRGAHRPNMQIVHAGDSRQRLERPDLGRPDPLSCARRQSHGPRAGSTCPTRSPPKSCWITTGSIQVRPVKRIIRRRLRPPPTPRHRRRMRESCSYVEIVLAAGPSKPSASMVATIAPQRRRSSPSAPADRMRLAGRRTLTQWRRWLPTRRNRIDQRRMDRRRPETMGETLGRPLRPSARRHSHQRSSPSPVCWHPANSARRNAPRPWAFGRDEREVDDMAAKPKAVPKTAAGMCMAMCVAMRVAVSMRVAVIVPMRIRR